MKTRDSSNVNRFGDKIKAVSAREDFTDIIRKVKLPCFYLEVADLGLFGTEKTVPLSSFIVFIKSGKVLILETKGDERDKTDSMQKQKLGQAWAAKGGENYKYFMIFDKKVIDGINNLNYALKIISEL